MSDRALTLNALLDMSPVLNGQDVVRLASRHLLLGQLKAQPSVRDVFFPGHDRDPVYGDRVDAAAADWFNFDDYAATFVCQAIVRAGDDFEIHSLLNEAAIDEKLQALHNGPDWKKLGFTLYTMLFSDLVRDEITKVSFKRYLGVDKNQNYSATWAKRICDAVGEKSWSCKYLNLMATGVLSFAEFGRQMNVLFVKLHLLDPTTVMPTFDRLAKVFPRLTLDLATNNYLGDPLEWTLIREEVVRAVSAPSKASNVSKMSLDDIELYFGIRVCEFILLEAKRLGLWTGTYPDNKRISHFRDRCKIM